LSRQLDAIKWSVRTGHHRFTVHSITRAGAHNITLDEVEAAILSDAAEIIEDYPIDPRGPSCLVYGETAGGIVLHIVCSHPPGVAIITSYRPDRTMWESDLKTRKRTTT
jgi:hypothetical protein